MSDPAAELRFLRSALPLGTHWGEIESYSEEVNIAGVEIHAVGLVSRSETGIEATGSAADLHGAPTTRAYFELLERTATIDRQDGAPIELLRQDGERTGYVAHGDVFPDSAAPHEFRYAMSNGVAAHTNLGLACASARMELVERDRVLRSWFGGPAPRRLNPVSFMQSSLFTATHVVEFYDFSNSDGSSKTSLAVAGVFAFPRRDTVPLVFGTGAGATLSDALQRAEQECLQRLAFLWGESIPEDVPAFEPTPSFHQELYLCPRMHGHIRSWLDGAHDLGIVTASGSTPRDPRFADLTPPHLRGRVWVVRALPGTELQLAFGREYPGIEPRLRHCGVHPIA